MLIHCSYWDPRADLFSAKSQMRDPDFRISVIADVTCDLNGSIPSTTQYTTIENKFYGYDPIAEKICRSISKNVITVMAIDNLPCELPRDASDGFGKHCLSVCCQHCLARMKMVFRDRATIVKDGKLTERFGYLKDYGCKMK